MLMNPLKTSANVQDVAVQNNSLNETKSEPGLPMVPGVDDVFAQQNPLYKFKTLLRLLQVLMRVNPAALWASVLNVIELLPAKFFFSSREAYKYKG